MSTRHPLARAATLVLFLAGLAYPTYLLSGDSTDSWVVVIAGIALTLLVSVAGGFLLERLWAFYLFLVPLVYVGLVPGDYQEGVGGRVAVLMFVALVGLVLGLVLRRAVQERGPRQDVGAPR